MPAEIFEALVITPEAYSLVVVALVVAALTISRLLMVEVALLTLRLPTRLARPEA